MIFNKSLNKFKINWLDIIAELRLLAKPSTEFSTTTNYLGFKL